MVQAVGMTSFFSPGSPCYEFNAHVEQDDVGASVSCVKAQEYNVGWYRVTYAPTGTAGRGFLMLEEELTTCLILDKNCGSD